VVRDVPLHIAVAPNLSEAVLFPFLLPLVLVRPDSFSPP
jgi:hypothetical protein